ncbi:MULTISPECIES: IclR family transcriptional regulator [unclassified Chelatococcus]|uniref:IclR family transcriptional regulator n=1 Tax=unclassified Chelatococcus TaxID=2638111 RepID=UPI001BCB9C1A|nr:MULTISPECIES: IclR family transcriptional regulator [unclassified Chelatococcus]CAH1648347.1 IclR family transcriptional regulator [Hyphomicrobiales bacterium]MBS7741979.1 IclR family transcriptional regulator [Chelatococcus sp. HY11]MBX3541223.1 IclR family transcriptional regulator [Chelatococcus sp.]MCO5074884.1 IclR family transcriptional regulator [Chelatococcus sp.]CAH1690829.1 IclR family transcriptional regulator [Hyphomicrobiales bacterium]
MRTAVDRIFDLLGALTERASGVSLQEAAQASRLSKPTAHRLLTDMIGRGIVRQDKASGNYALTLELALIAFKQLGELGFLDICQPTLDELAALSGELVRLAWRDHDRLVILSEAQGAKPGLRFDANLGRPVVLHTMAAGKVFLASQPRAEALRLVRKQGLMGSPDTGPNAIQSEDELALELSRVERQGYALAYDEGDLGAAAIAVPILDPKTHVFLGSVAIVGPTVRWTKAKLSELAPSLNEAAAAIAGKAAIAPFCRRIAEANTRTSRAG